MISIISIIILLSLRKCKYQKELRACYIVMANVKAGVAGMCMENKIIHVCYL